MQVSTNASSCNKNKYKHVLIFVFSLLFWISHLIQLKSKLKTSVVFTSVSVVFASVISVVFTSVVSVVFASEKKKK